MDRRVNVGAPNRQNTWGGAHVGTANRQNTWGGAHVGTANRQNDWGGANRQNAWGGPNRQNTWAGAHAGAPNRQNVWGGAHGAANRQNVWAGGAHGAANRQNVWAGGAHGAPNRQNVWAGGVRLNAPIVQPPQFEEEDSFSEDEVLYSEDEDLYPEEEDPYPEDEDEDEDRVIPMPIQPREGQPEIPPDVANAEADKVMEIFPNIEKDFLIKHIRKGFYAQEVIQQLTDEVIHPPREQSPGRIHDVSIELLDGEESEVPEEENPFNEEAKQRLLQHLEVGLQVAYSKLRNNTLDNRFKLQERVDSDYINKTIAPNLLAPAVKTVIEYALTAENAIVALLLLSWFEEKDTPDLVCQRFVSQMMRTQTSIVGRRKDEIQKLTDQLKLCYKQRGRKPKRDFGSPPQCFQKIVDIVQKLLDKPGETFECPICADEKAVAKSIKCESMDGEDQENEHKFCIDCVKGYGEASVSEPNVADGGEGLRCMQPGCKGILKHAAVISCIPKNQKHTRRLLEKRFTTAAIVASGIKPEECHFCSYAEIIEEPPEVNKVFNCVKCRAKFCRICKKIWSIHIGKKCHEVANEQEMTPEERARVKLEEELSKVSIRYCQHCNIPFRKDGGCNKMTCRCGRFQCYMCNVPIKTYDHFCTHEPNRWRPGVCSRKCGKCMLHVNPETQEAEARKKLIDSYKGQISEEQLRLLY